MSSRPLRELDPKWIWRKPEGGRIRESLECPLKGMERVGIQFNCPTCDPPHIANAYWVCPFQSDHVWIKKGDTLENITLYPSLDASSVEGMDCKFHGWLKDGQVTW